MPTFSVLPPLSELSGAGVIFAAVTGMAYAVHLFFAGLKKLKFEGRLSSALSSSAGSLAMGPVELSGTAVAAASLLDPVYNRPCAYYRVDINEAHVGAGKAGRGLLGRLNNRDRKHYCFGAPVSLFHADSGAVPLLLSDATGLAPVYPEGAEFLRKSTLDIFQKRQGDQLADPDPSVAQFLNKIPRQYGVHLRAVIIREGDPLHVWGLAGEAATPLAAGEEPGRQTEWLPAARAGLRGAVRKSPDGFFVISDGAGCKPPSAFLPLRSFSLLIRGPLLFIFCFLYLLYRTNILGAVYASGWGPVPQNEAWAAALFKGNCGSGDTYACGQLSRLTARRLAVSSAEARAAALLKAASEAGQKVSYWVPPLEAAGKGPAQDRIQIKRLPGEADLFRRECDSGDARKCQALGALYLAGREVEQDYSRAAALFKQACGGKIVEACTSLAGMYASGQGLGNESRSSAALLRKACDGSDPVACATTASVLVKRGLPGEAAKGPGSTDRILVEGLSSAATANRKGCDEGNAGNCLGLGLMYLGGIETDKDEVRAAGLFKRACDGKNMAGCTTLATMHLLGQGVPRDLARAAVLLKPSCAGGDPFGCGILGALYMDGMGVERDPARAAALYEQACAGRVWMGCTSLGGLYAAGTGVVKDEARAAALYKQACDAGSAKGCALLARPR